MASDSKVTEHQASEARPGERFSGLAYQSLALFRFFSFALGIGLIFGLHDPDQPIRVVVVVALAAVFNILVVLFRVNLSLLRLGVRWAFILSELALSISLVLLTGALDSPFLVYSLAPLLTTSLMTDFRSTTVVAVITALSNSGGHVAAGLGLSDYPWVLNGNYLAFILLYSAVCLLISALPFISNLNFQRRVRTESTMLERQRLRREVHDNVAQTLAFLSLKAKRAEELSQSGKALGAKDIRDIAGAVEQAYLGVRDYLDDTAGRLGQGSLGSRLVHAVNEWSGQAGLPVNLRVDRRDLKLGNRVEQQLLQIAREALVNAGKHSLAKNVWVQLSADDHNVTIMVRDDGRGFHGSQPKGHGTEIMKERAAMIGAALDISSTPGKGTTVQVVYPISKEGAKR